MDSHVGLIYGDSISLERAYSILSGLEFMGFSSGNIVFGIGSFTYQYSTRDAFGNAIKATNAWIASKRYALFKDPKTDDGIKKSARGYIWVEEDGGNFIPHEDCSVEEEQEGELRTVLLNGVLIFPYLVSEVRDNIEMELDIVMAREFPSES